MPDEGTLQSFFPCSLQISPSFSNFLPFKNNPGIVPGLLSKTFLHLFFLFDLHARNSLFDFQLSQLKVNIRIFIR